MIEILFRDSACGSLQAAQHYGEGEFHSNTDILVTRRDGSKPTEAEMEAIQREAEKRELLAWESGIPLGGNSADIYGFNLVLSIGDISENQPGIKRKQTLEHLYSVYPNDEGQTAAHEIMNSVNKNLKAVRERTAAGESLRIWYSRHPDETCGFYWFLEQLNQWNVQSNQIFTVELPEWEANEKGNIVQFTSWGEVACDEWNRHLDLQKPMLPVFYRSCAFHWRALQKENAPLRATLNGQLVSAPETLYDNFILREIAAENETFQEAMVVGRTLGKYQLGIGDSWVALRIEEMIHAGRLEVVTPVAEDMPSYHRILKKQNPINK